MGKLTLKLLWDLRGQLDDAIISQKYDKIPKIKNDYKNLIEYEKPYNLFFVGHRTTYQSKSSTVAECNLNMRLILENIENFERKYIQKEDVSLKFENWFQESCYANEIWVLRAMFDKFVLSGTSKQDAKETERNSILGKSIIDRIRALVASSLHEYERNELLIIEDEIEKTYKEICGSQPKINYDAVLYDFLEK